MRNGSITLRKTHTLQRRPAGKIAREIEKISGKPGSLMSDRVRSILKSIGRVGFPSVQHRDQQLVYRLLNGETRATVAKGNGARDLNEQQAKVYDAAIVSLEVAANHWREKLNKVRNRPHTDPDVVEGTREWNDAMEGMRALSDERNAVTALVERVFPSARRYRATR
jgi:hypothetical protein